MLQCFRVIALRHRTLIRLPLTTLLALLSTVVCLQAQDKVPEKINTYISTARNASDVLEALGEDLKHTRRNTTLRASYIHVRNLIEAYNVALQLSIESGTLEDDSSELDTLAGDLKDEQLRFIRAALSITDPQVDTRGFPVAALLIAEPLHAILMKLSNPLRKKLFATTQHAAALRAWREL